MEHANKFWGRTWTFGGLLQSLGLGCLLRSKSSDMCLCAWYCWSHLLQKLPLEGHNRRWNSVLLQATRGIISTIFLKFRNNHGLFYKELQKISSIDASSSGRGAGCITYPQKGTSVTNKNGKPIFCYQLSSGTFEYALIWGVSHYIRNLEVSVYFFKNSCFPGMTYSTCKC